MSLQGGCTPRRSNLLLIARLFLENYRSQERQRKTMAYKKILMKKNKKIALVAHDNKKQDLVEWAKFNQALLAHHEVYATGTTGAMLEHKSVTFIVYAVYK
jgi:hypothetical protein